MSPLNVILQFYLPEPSVVYTGLWTQLRKEPCFRLRQKPSPFRGKRTRDHWMVCMKLSAHWSVNPVPGPIWNTNSLLLILIGFEGHPTLQMGKPAQRPPQDPKANDRKAGFKAWGSTFQDTAEPSTLTPQPSQNPDWKAEKALGLY